MEAYQRGFDKALSAAEILKETTIKCDLSHFTAEQTRQFINGVIDGAIKMGRQIKGVRTEVSTFMQLRIVKDRENSGKYRDIPFVEIHESLIGRPIEIVITAK